MTPFLGMCHIPPSAEGAEEKFWPEMGLVDFAFKRGRLFLVGKKKLPDSLKKTLVAFLFFNGLESPETSQAW